MVLIEFSQNRRLIWNSILFFLLFFIIITILPIAGQIASYFYQSARNNDVPSLSYSTFFGGLECDIGNGIAIANDGSLYIVGSTESGTLPIQDAYDDTINGDYDVFVAKFSSSASLLWSTFLGGSGTDHGNDIVVDAEGSCYVTGWTDSSNFPAQNANDSSYNSFGDAFITKFSTSGSLLWSTFFGGGYIDRGNSITLAEDGNCFITGETGSTDLPMKNASDNTYNGGHSDAFIAKFTDNGLLLWSTFIGGNLWDRGHSIAVANNGDCFVTGYTTSANFTTFNAYDDLFKGPNTAFVAKFTSNGSLNWSTFIGGNETDSGSGIAAGIDNSCYVTGSTSSDNFPTVNASDPSYNDGGDAFVVKFSNNGSLLFSTFLGGSLLDYGKSITIADDGNCYIIGSTDSVDFPTVNVDNNFLSGSIDALVAKFSSNGSLLWSRYLGGNDGEWGRNIVVSNSTVFVTGYTYSTNFPTINAYNDEMRGCSDAFVSLYNGIDFPITPTTPDTITPTVDGSIAVGLLSPIIVLITTFTVIIIIRRKKKYN